MRGRCLVSAGVVSVIAALAAAPVSAQVYPTQADRAGGSVRRRRHHRQHRAADGAAVHRELVADRDRQQSPRRRQHDRNVGGREVRARRPYALGHDLRLCRRARAAEGVVRSDQGFCADHRACLAADDASGASIGAGDEPRGVHRAGEVECERPGLRVVRPRHVDPSRRRDVQHHGRRPPGARSLQGQRRSVQRAARWPHQGALQPGAERHRACAGREVARARRHQRDAPAVSAGCSDHRGVRFPQLRDQLVAGRAGSRRNAFRHCRQDQRRAIDLLKTPAMRERMAREGADPVGSTPQQFAQRVASELDKWAKVAKAAGLASH